MNNRLTLLTSILTTVSNPSNVQIYFGVDVDDPTFDLITKIERAIPCVTVVPIPKFDKFPGLGKLWNICAKESSEEIISMIGDDMIFQTQNWDEKLLNEFEKMPDDNIQGIYCNDGHHGHRLAVNFFCHRDFLLANGGKFMREEFKINWIDTWLEQVFRACGRLTYRGDIMIRHNHFIFTGSGPDRVAAKMAVADVDKISDKLWKSLVNERVNDVKKLAAYIEVTPDWSKVDIEGATNM